jgi:hypothetical protein
VSFLQPVTTFSRPPSSYLGDMPRDKRVSPSPARFSARFVREAIGTAPQVTPSTPPQPLRCPAISMRTMLCGHQPFHLDILSPLLGVP